MTKVAENNLTHISVDLENGHDLAFRVWRHSAAAHCVNRYNGDVQFLQWPLYMSNLKYVNSVWIKNMICTYVSAVLFSYFNEFVIESNC